MSDDTLKHINSLVPSVAQKAYRLVLAARQAGIPMVLTSGRRSTLQQFGLWARGRFTSGRVVTNTITRSRHLSGRAFDFLVVGFHPDRYSGLYTAIGRAGERLGLQWGGRWRTLKDKVHFQG